MISDAVTKFITEFEGLVTTLTFEEITTIRTRFDDEVTVMKDKAKASFSERYEADRLALEEKFKAEAKAAGVDMFDEDVGGKRQKLPPVYRDPEQPDKTWSGRGKRPEWFTINLANGITEAAMRIQPVTPGPAPSDIPF